MKNGTKEFKMIRVKVIKKDTGNVLEGEYMPNMLETNWMRIQVDTINGEPFQYEEFEAYDWHNIDKNNCSLIEFL